VNVFAKNGVQLHIYPSRVKPCFKLGSYRWDQVLRTLWECLSFKTGAF